MSAPSPDFRVSVVIPSRLAKDRSGELWLSSATRGISNQLLTAVTEIIVCLDPGVAPPDFDGAKFVNATKPGQAAALNAGIDAATEPYIAFLEDDDHWEPPFLLYAQGVLQKGFDFVSSGQLEFDDEGRCSGYNDHPTPSGWLMTSEAAKPGFDESYRWHVDSQFLGRLNADKVKRAHMLEANWKLHPDPRRPLWGTLVSRNSEIAFTDYPRPLVNRVLHKGSGMAHIGQRGSLAQMESVSERERLNATYGSIPW